MQMTDGISVTETVKASERNASTPSDEWAPIPDWDKDQGGSHLRACELRSLGRGSSHFHYSYFKKCLINSFS